MLYVMQKSAVYVSSYFAKLVLINRQKGNAKNNQLTLQIVRTVEKSLNLSNLEGELGKKLNIFEFMCPTCK